MHVLVVGGTGVVGRGLVAALLAAGHEVTSISRGTRAGLPAEVRRVAVDRFAYGRFVEAVRSLRPDAVVDLVCFGAVDARSAIAACAGVDHYVFASSIAAYGLGDGAPLREDAPLRPLKPYGRGKVAAERFVLDAARAGFPGTVVRLAIVYGPGGFLPRQAADDWFWQERLAAGKPILVVGDGSARHQFLHASDAGRAVAALLGRTSTFGRVLNVVGEEAITWRAYHECAARVVTGTRGVLAGASLESLLAVDPIRFDECDELSAHDVLFDGSLLREELPDWRPQVPLAAGVTEVLEHLEAHPPDEERSDWEDWVIEQVGATPLR